MAYVEYYVDSAAGGSGDGSSGDPWTWAEMMGELADLAGTEPVRVNVKGAFDFGGASQVLAGFAPTVGNPLYLRAYTTTPGDGGLVEIDSTAATVMTLPAFGFVEGFDYVGVGSTYITNGGTLYRCRGKITGNQSSVIFDVPINIAFCMAHSTGSSSTKAAIRTAGTVYRNYAKMEDACSVAFVLNSNLGSPVYGNILHGMGSGMGINRPASDRVVDINGNIIFDFATAINVPSGNYDLVAAIARNICFKGTDGIKIAGTARMLLEGNAIGEMATSRYDYANGDLVMGDIVLTTTAVGGSPFVDSANGNFTLNPSTANGLALINAGYPRIAGFDYNTMLPVAHPAAGGSGGTRIPRARHII